MPVYSKRDRQAPNAGNYRIRALVYDPALGVGPEGGVLRDPSGVGELYGGDQPTGQLLWEDRVSKQTYGMQGRENDKAEVTEAYFLIECRWARFKVYRAGQIIWIPGSSESFTVMGVEIVLDQFHKFQLTCRRVR